MSDVAFVSQVAYMVKYSPDGEILNVTLSLVIGFIRESQLPLQQEFQIQFFQVRTNSDTMYVCMYLVQIWFCHLALC